MNTLPGQMMTLYFICVSVQELVLTENMDLYLLRMSDIC